MEKATAILAELSGAAGPLTLSQLTRRTGIAKTTTHRLLSELLADGLVLRSQTQYWLNSRVSWLAAPINERICRIRKLHSPFLPHLLDLYETTRQTVNLVALQGDEVIYVDRIYGHNRVRSRSDGSDRAPACLTAAGKVLLAYETQAQGHLVKSAAQHDRTWNAKAKPDLEAELDYIRHEGVAFSFGELTPGVHCVAAPVRDRTGRPLAAVALAGLARDFDPVRFTLILRRTAHAMSLIARGQRRQQSTRRPAR